MPELTQPVGMPSTRGMVFAARYPEGLKNIIKEVTSDERDVCLFIDEPAAQSLLHQNLNPAPTHSSGMFPLLLEVLNRDY